MLRVRPGVELVRASLVPTKELMTLDLPTFERPRKAISGSEGTGKWETSVAAAKNRDRTLISKFAMEVERLASWGSGSHRDTQAKKKPRLWGLQRFWSQVPFIVSMRRNRLLRRKDRSREE